MATYDIGDVVEITAVFSADPTDVTFKVKPPNGAAIVTYTESDDEVTNPSTKTYVLTLQPDTGGRWNYKVFGTGANKAAEEGSFDIRPTSFS